jgi:signal transduction histidine kinase/DNA-binding response OmpR family regulator
MHGPDYQAVFKQSPNPSILITRDLVVADVNLVLQDCSLAAGHELVGQAFFQVFSHLRVLTDDTIVQQLRDSFETVLREARRDVLDGVRLGGCTGGLACDVDWQITSTPLCDARGVVQHILVQAFPADSLGQRVQACTQQLLDSEEQRTAAQMALFQSRKVEALGKLTGGVAHDFNNVLQIIGASLDLLSSEAGKESRVQRRIDAARAAVERGERLTSQLLSFARRQPLTPVVIDPAGLLRDMDQLLHHALGEMIRLDVQVAPDAWNVHVDTHHFENVVLNLALNARDAMEGQGVFTIHAGNVVFDAAQAGRLPEIEPGEYLRFSFSDTGCGMERSVLEQVFEPFFTTKEAGKGTGLGLSMAYGFVRQSNGHIDIASKPGEGTRIDIYLPRCLRKVETRPAVGRKQPDEGSGTVLVVEDDDAVRQAAADMLAGLGYVVLQAPDAMAAWDILRQDVQVDVIFADVVTPGPLRTSELTQRALELNDDIDVLYTSGYPEGALQDLVAAGSGVNLLLKPYGQDELAARIRHLIRNRQQRAMLRDATLAPTEGPHGDDGHALLSRFGALRILLVEDSPDTLHATTDLLEMLGHRVTPVASAEDALQALSRDTFDVMCSDIELPGMSGQELARRVRRDYPQVGIIFASGHGTRAGGAQVDAVVLPKPYRIADMENALETVMLAR